MGRNNNARKQDVVVKVETDKTLEQLKILNDDALSNIYKALVLEKDIKQII